MQNVSTQSQSRRKTAALACAVVAANVFGNLFLSHGMKDIGRLISGDPLAYLRTFANPWILVGVATLFGWMLLDLALLSRADLTFVLPVTASAYVLIAVAGHYWFGEAASVSRWIGIAIITLGATLAAETPPKTTEGLPEDLL